MHKPHPGRPGPRAARAHASAPSAAPPGTRRARTRCLGHPGVIGNTGSLGMSGHNKWSTIKHKKAAVDAKRSKVWTKIIKEITVSARIGGGDAAGNARLRSAIDKARAANMPNDNITRAIKKGTGADGGVHYEELMYEAYGPGGVALLVEILTDSRNRTASEIRHVLEKHNGKLAAAGAVAYLFK